MSEAPSDRRDSESAAMDVVRALHQRDRVGQQAVARRPWLPRVIGLALALGVVIVFALGLDAFLAAMQRILEMPAGGQPAAPADAPIPVYVVPEDLPPDRDAAGQ